MIMNAERDVRHPLISVIIPVYKVEKYLEQCIRSVVSQTYRNLEIILVDDGSPDQCPRLCDEWANKDSRIRVIHQNNRGLAAARNSGLDVASGKYIGFVDSDDWIEPDMYESMLHDLLEANADIAYTCSYHALSNGEISTKHLVHKAHLVLSNGAGFKYINLPGYFGVAAWDKLLKRTIVGDLRFPEDARRDEDYGFAYATLDRAQTVVYDSTPKYYYRQSIGTLSNSVSMIGTHAVEETEKMVEMVERKYPDQLPFALYGQLLVMLGTWDQVVASGQTNLPQWRQFYEKLRFFIDQHLSIIKQTVHIPRSRLIQVQLLRSTPALYIPMFKFYKTVHPQRVS